MELALLYFSDGHWLQELGYTELACWHSVSGQLKIDSCYIFAKHLTGGILTTDFTDMVRRVARIEFDFCSRNTLIVTEDAIRFGQGN